MSRGKVLSWLKLNLVVGLIFKVLITSYACKASAESLPIERLKETETLPPPQVETSEPGYSSTVPPTILSQVPNPITPVPPPQPIPAPEPPPETPLDITPTTQTPSEIRPDIPGVLELLDSSLKVTQHLAIKN